MMFAKLPVRQPLASCARCRTSQSRPNFFRRASLFTGVPNLRCSASKNVSRQSSTESSNEVLPAERLATSSTELAAQETKAAQQPWQFRPTVFPLVALVAGVFGTGFDVQGPGSVLESLAVLAAIVTVHECGHFLAARSQGIHVTKFAVGFGPPIIKYQGPIVEYSLRAIPLGGFVAFPDDDPNSAYPPDDPNLLKNRPILDRAIVISAGVIANMIFAFTVLLAQASSVGVAESIYKAGVRVPEVVPQSVAARSGIMPGDIIMQVGDYLVPARNGAVAEVVSKIRANPERPLTVRLDRKGSEVQVDVVPSVAPDGGGRIGVQLAANGEIRRKVAESPVQAVTMATTELKRLTGAVVGGLQQIFTNFSQTAEQVSGPVAIVAVGAEAVRNDITGLFQFAAILNVNLAVVNMLPLPALDGGYLFLLLIELLRGGKKLPEGVEQGVMASGLLLLTALGFALIVHDTMSLGIFKAFLQ